MNRLSASRFRADSLCVILFFLGEVSHREIFLHIDLCWLIFAHDQRLDLFLFFSQ